MKKSIQFSLRIQQEFINEIDNLVEKNEYDSRASAIRRAIKEFLDKRKIRY